MNRKQPQIRERWGPTSWGGAWLADHLKTSPLAQPCNKKWRWHVFRRAARPAGRPRAGWEFFGKGQRAIPHHIGSMRERCKLPSWVRAGAPVQIDFSVIFGLQMVTGSDNNSEILTFPAVCIYVKMWIWAWYGVESRVWANYQSGPGCNSCFRSITYLLTVSAISDGFSAVIGPVGPKSHSQMVDTETSIFAGLSISCSCRNSISGRTSTSGIAAELRETQTLRTGCSKAEPKIFPTQAGPSSISVPNLKRIVQFVQKL